ncbi:MAG: ATP-binding protein [Pseudomonadota bacterium]
MLLIAGLTVVLIYLDRLVAKAQRQDAAIRATTDRLASTVAASLDGIVTADEKGEIVGYNDAAEHIFGWTRDEILGRKLDDTLVPQAHRAAHGQGMARYLSTREPHVIDAGRLELSALRKTGEEFPVEMNITSTSQDGRELFIAYLRDISERKINERKLIDARDQAERTDRAKSQFLAVTSHEMRTPLNGILGVLDLLRTTELDEKQTKFVKVAAASGEILLEHVNEALDITRIETGAMSLTIRPFAMHEIVSRIVDVLQPLASEKGLRLDYKIEPAMDGGFVGDSGRISQILTNLLGNAIKFTDSGHIALEVTGIHGVEATALEISVKDTGAGIPAERVDDIFEDFVVLAQSEGRQDRGDGLGLSISRKVARLMGGDLTVQSELGKGSEFTLKLTLERDDIEVEKPAEPRTLPHDRPKTVLIVEDNAINRSVLREMLVGFDHSVEEAENGLEGVKAASKKVYDVIFMDISMPFMDGIEATKRIRQDPGPNQRSFILGLTAHGQEEYRMKAEASGMDAFMTKPLRLSALKQMMSGIAPAVSAEIGQAGLIDEEVVRDLNAVLGSEKAKSTADRFRKELSESISDLRNRSCEEEAPIISESLHKMRGAAVLLGLTMLAEKIDQTSKFGKENNSAAFLGSLDDIQAVADTSLAVFSASLTTSSDEPLS